MEIIENWHPLCVCVYMYMYMYVYVYVCMYVCIYVYIYIYIFRGVWYTGAGHIIRISSKSWFISLIPFKKVKLV